jgi:aminoglycoside phosphotransferase (APT) family kinase protein
MAPNPFGHDRRADRFDGLVLAYDGFGRIPDHVAALDVGALDPDGAPISLRGAGEPYLVTEFAAGRPYADDLRAVAARGAEPLDLARCDVLVDWLVRLHATPVGAPVAWRRAVRDLVGHGEGIFGIVDGYGDDVPAAPPARLEALESRALAWRWRLRSRASRLRQTHGDFHPFNVIFAEGTRFTLLDSSRGGLGDPADDLAALTINYPFFAIDKPGAWSGLGALWRRAWARYLAASGDLGLLEVVAPFLAWRALVLACPRFYPGLSPQGRDALLGLAERALDATAFHPAWAEELFG